MCRTISQTRETHVNKQFFVCCCMLVAVHAEGNSGLLMIIGGRDVVRKLSVIPKVGFNATMCEAVYLNYIDRVLSGLRCGVLWLVLSYCKRGPMKGTYDDISPRHRKHGDFDCFALYVPAFSAFA